MWSGRQPAFDLSAGPQGTEQKIEMIVRLSSAVEGTLTILSLSWGVAYSPMRSSSSSFSPNLKRAPNAVTSTAPEMASCFCTTHKSVTLSTVYITGRLPPVLETVRLVLGVLRLLAHSWWEG